MTSIGGGRVYELPPCNSTRKWHTMTAYEPQGKSVKLVCSSNAWRKASDGWSDIFSGRAKPCVPEAYTQFDAQSVESKNSSMCESLVDNPMIGEGVATAGMILGTMHGANKLGLTTNNDLWNTGKSMIVDEMSAEQNDPQKPAISTPTATPQPQPPQPPP